VELRSDTVIIDAATRKNLELDQNLSGGRTTTSDKWNCAVTR